jgi:hypothetical protein
LPFVNDKLHEHKHVVGGYADEPDLREFSNDDGVGVRRR